MLYIGIGSTYSGGTRPENYLYLSSVPADDRNFSQESVVVAASDSGKTSDLIIQNDLTKFLNILRDSGVPTNIIVIEG